MSRIRTLSILAVVILLTGMNFSKEGNGEYRRPQSNDKIEKLETAVKKLQSEVKTLHTKIETIPEFEKYDKEQIGFLEEYLKNAESIHSTVNARYRVGSSSIFESQMALFELHKAKARLARAKGNLSLCQKEYEAALKAAVNHAEALETSLRLGLNPLSGVLRARSMVLETKLDLSRIKKINRRTQK